MPRAKNWTGKNSAHKLWTEINNYVDVFTSTHQSHLETEWFHKWYRIYQIGRIGERRIPYEVAALTICENPDATINDCVTTLKELIPELSLYLRIHQIGEQGNIRYTFEDYGFKTPPFPIKATNQQPTQKATTSSKPG